MRIDGTRSSFYLGVTPAMAKWRPDGYGRIASPVIQSVDLRDGAFVWNVPPGDVSVFEIVEK